MTEAHRQGLRVWSHAVIFPAMAADAVAVGVDVLSHASMLAAITEAAPRAYAHREPTLWVFQSGAGGDTLPIARFGAAVTRRAQELGVPILAGTDAL